MGWFDNLIGWFSPKTACEREAWRLQLQQLRGAGYLSVAALPCSLIPTPPDDEQLPGTFSFTGGF